MAIANRLRWYLDAHGVQYDVLHHSHSKSSLGSARAAQVPGDRLAKCVLLEDERGYLLAVLPASHRMMMRALGAQLERRLELASEAELRQLFADCEVGAVPPLGSAYGIPTLIDDSLLSAPEVYFEAGDHEELIHMRGAEFLALMAGARHGRFSRRA